MPGGQGHGLQTVRLHMNALGLGPSIAVPNAQTLAGGIGTFSQNGELLTALEYSAATLEVKSAPC